MKRIILSIAVIGMISCAMAFQKENPEEATRGVEIIIKVEPETIIMPEGVYKAPLDEIEIKSEPLRELNKKFNLDSIERLFVRKDEEETSENLEDIFLLRFPEHIPLDVLIKEYEELDEVIYVEENKRVGIF